METPIYIALSRQAALGRELNTVANNIANGSTDGYRGEHVLFQEVLERTGSPGRRDRLSFMQDSGQYRDLREGELAETQNPLDLALRGDGYFAIDAPGQTLYTRAGQFRLDAQRRIVTAQGYPLLQANGRPLTVGAGDLDGVTVTRDGTVTQSVAGAPAVTLGRIGAVAFSDDQALRQASAGLYATDQPPRPAGQAAIVQGAVEKSNVQPVIEITRMIELSRDYQSIQRLLDNEDQRLRETTQKLIKTEA